jgi:hypothetical protein
VVCMTEVASGARACFVGRSGVGVGKGVAAQHNIAQAATTGAEEFAGGGDLSVRTRTWVCSECSARHTHMLKRQGRQRHWLRPASEWRARGGDSSQGPCRCVGVRGDVATMLCSGGHVAEGAGGIRHDEEELGGARGS